MKGRVVGFNGRLDRAARPGFAIGVGGSPSNDIRVFHGVSARGSLCESPAQERPRPPSGDSNRSPSFRSGRPAIPRFSPSLRRRSINPFPARRTP